MSFSFSRATATCTVASLGTPREVALSIYDYFVNHPDEIPPDLDDLDSDDFVLEIENYIGCNGETLTLSYDTEQSNNSSEVFDWLFSHFVFLQSSLFMKCTWCVEDSRTGIDYDINYYDRNNKLLDVEAVLEIYLSTSIT